MTAESTIPDIHSSSSLADEDLILPCCHCITQEVTTSGAAAVYVGFLHTAAHWSKDPDVKFAIARASFPPHINIDYVEACLFDAVKQWHGTGVCIRQARPGEAITFVVAYQDKPSEAQAYRALARSFFPSSELRDRVLFVYNRCFWTQYVKFMSNVLSHELGHVLGLRHEFLEDERSMLIRCPNPNSVMNYYNDLSMMKVTLEDIKGVREFYRLEGRVGNWQIMVVRP
ncbi:hypothetical protein F4678DRAFT_413978 [Xylaria arbuscula]|nr:hypothetical protein F4678DRAFT_413978 [Xylaria arbuscula]